MPRANWKGHLKLDLLTCPVALYTAASTSDRIELNTLNRETHNRVRREWVDEETGKSVAQEETVRGYEVATGEYVILEKEEVDATVPVSDKTITIERFVPVDQIDEVFFDRPYYLAAADRPGQEAFAVVRDALERSGTIALGRAVLFRRERWLALMPRDGGILAHTLHFANEVRAADAVFEDVADIAIVGEMLDLARHIIETKAGTFEPEAINDRYEEALTELIRAKQAGRAPKIAKPAKTDNVVDLMEALRRSAGVSATKDETTKPRASGVKAAKSQASGRKRPAAATRSAPARKPQRKAG